MSQTGEVTKLMLIGLGLGANAVIWVSYLIMRWSRPRPARWEQFDWKQTDAKNTVR